MNRKDAITFLLFCSRSDMAPSANRKFKMEEDKTPRLEPSSWQFKGTHQPQRFRNRFWQSAKTPPQLKTTHLSLPRPPSTRDFFHTGKTAPDRLQNNNKGHQFRALVHSIAVSSFAARQSSKIEGKCERRGENYKDYFVIWGDCDSSKNKKNIIRDRILYTILTNTSVQSTGYMRFISLLFIKFSMNIKKTEISIIEKL